MEPGLFLGYRRTAKGSGRWVMRHYAGDEKYTTSVLATADDYSDPDHGPDNFAALDLSKIGDTSILDFWQAQTLVRFRSRVQRVGEAAKPYTVNDAMADYFVNLEEQGKPPSENQERRNLEWAEREARRIAKEERQCKASRTSVAVQWSRSTAVVTGAK